MAMSTATVLRSTAHRSRQLSSISMAMAMATAKGRSHRGVGTLGDPPAAGGASGGQGQELALMAPPTTASYSSHSSASSSSSSSPSSPSHTAHPHATAGGSAAGPNTSTSQWPTLRRHLHATSRIPAHYSFDTASFVNRLEREGLSRKQSVGIMEALEEVVEESIRTMTANLVTRAEQEKHQYTQKVDFAKLKSEITLLEKQDFSLLKSENERLLSEVERLKQRLREEITRTQAGVRLDLNLEKGRIRDELSAREVKIKEVDTRIESEISTIRAQMESVKFGILQYVVGSTTGLFALLLAYLRFLS